MESEGHFNRLKDEKSSYLLQHKNNPVHWYSYGPMALQRAKDENLPIFLSVGYSACHWCHVMAHESFEDQNTADFLNKNFICIKVDREEHPDLDQYYQQACQLFTQSGGWPLSAFLLPDMRPYFVGTYFPKEAKYGRNSFMELITELSRAFRESDPNAIENAEKVTKALEDGLLPKEKVPFEGHFPAPMAIMHALEKQEDAEYGGYGSAPKFPNFPFYEYAFDQILEGQFEKEKVKFIAESFDKILMGGIFDHCRGGIHRYSVDKMWLVPHFEKMLYDQSGLLRCLSRAGLINPSPVCFDALYDTLDYLEFEMLSDQGYFFSAQDADSEGHEGLFFTFTKEEFVIALKSNTETKDLDIDKMIKWFQLTDEGNFEKGLNVISLDPAFKEEFQNKDGWDSVRKIRLVIREERKKRIPPATDSKGVASWNFMLLSAFVDVIQYCPIDPIKRKASSLLEKTLQPILDTFLVKEINSNPMDPVYLKISHTTSRGDSLPYLEDYANFLDLQLRLYEFSANPIFKENFLETFKFTSNQFVDGTNLLTRAKYSNDFELYPNQPINCFDSSFRSPASVFIHVARRAQVLFPDEELTKNLSNVFETSINDCLKAPLHSGEALKAHTYPTEVYRVIKIPTSWSQNAEFLNFSKYFLSRFVFDFFNPESNEEKEERWQVCSLTECQLQGMGLQNFFEALSPPKN